MVQFVDISSSRSSREILGLLQTLVNVGGKEGDRPPNKMLGPGDQLEKYELGPQDSTVL